MRLTEEELHDVLARAEEIDRATRQRAERTAELSAVIEAAEEVGLSRHAIERAMTERLDLPTGPPVAGEMTWARAGDGKYYVADVLSISDQAVRVRFHRGSEQSLSVDELRPCAFNPGDRITCNWPMWGAWTCTVVGYDAGTQRVELSDGWGHTESFRVADVWLRAGKDEARTARRRVYAMLLGTGAVAGALIGSLLTGLLM